MTTITNKKQYPSEQYLNELITNIEFAARAPVEVVRAMAAELQKRREADSAEPIAYIFKHPAGKLFWALTDESNKEQADVIPVYAAAPASVVPDNASEPLAYTYKELTPEIMRNHLAVFERYGIAPNDSSTTIQALRIALDGIERSDAMLHGAEPVSQNDKLPELSDNYPVTPDGLSTVCAEAYQVVGVMADALGVFGDAAVQKVLDNLSQQKLVHRDVLPFSLSVTPDGWISCSERMPVIGELNWRTSFPLLVTCEIGVIPAYYGFVRVNGNKHYGFMESLKYGDDSGNHPQTNEYDLISNVTHWMPLPEPPEQDGE
ncbi:DUF551 domain-containing protein [Salmonella enterica]|nr:DUF551 domain-containing protein [Salmonella enterica]HCM4215532.1 DUF551 domain-containing protein [Salmonella enterica subsp. enterica serovar Agama]EIL4027504.1 DUF551 domain-containing protein [Salmonella enterica]EIL4081672.1 DUF551 domain-containing protein [Salmonella enterica]EJG7295478.1 DUF551 domain-containing protein [Salmonella enterica]